MTSTGARRKPQKYPDELRERAVRMVLEIRHETGEKHGAVTRVAPPPRPGPGGARGGGGAAGGGGGGGVRGVSGAGRTTSSKPRRFSSRPSSTVVRSGSRLHRRPPDAEVRWAAMG